MNEFYRMIRMGVAGHVGGNQDRSKHGRRTFGVSGYVQRLMFFCGAEIVPKCSQCEQKPYPLCNLQHSLLI